MTINIREQKNGKLGVIGGRDVGAEATKFVDMASSTARIEGWRVWATLSSWHFRFFVLPRLLNPTVKLSKVHYFRYSFVGSIKLLFIPDALYSIYVCYEILHTGCQNNIFSLLFIVLHTILKSKQTNNNKKGPVATSCRRAWWVGDGDTIYIYTYEKNALCSC